MKYFLILTIIYSFNSWANFQQLGKEFLDKNTSVNNLLGNVLKADQGIKMVESTLAPKITSEVSYLDNNSDSANAVNFAAGKTTSVDLNFSKATSWGGVFSFANSYEKVIQDPSRIIIFGGDPEISQFRQALSFSTSLTRNFFGAEFDLNHHSSIMNAEYVDALSKHSVNNLFVQFAQAYSVASLHKSLYAFQNEALKRAEKRLALVKRRVSDGINLKADLFRAESAKIFQEEQLDQARQDLNQAIYNLSNILHRPVDLEELERLETLGTYFDKMNLQNSKMEREELVVSARKRFADQQELNKDLSERQMLPDVNFTAAYQTNDFDANSSTVFSEGNLGGDRNTLSVGVTFTYNFGRVSERANLAQAEINHNQALHQLSAEVHSNKQKRKMLEENISLSTANTQKAKKRVSLSNAIIKEYVKLFSLGRVTLDQVIQAEEDLINEIDIFSDNE